VSVSSRSCRGPWAGSARRSLSVDVRRRWVTAWPEGIAAPLPGNPGGPPAPAKPDITVTDYEPGDTTSIFLNLRVADIEAGCRLWTERGVRFLTPPIDRQAESRCYMRDPDGCLIEVGQATGRSPATWPRSGPRTFRADIFARSRRQLRQ
jgi:hypothetical protein